MSKGEEKVRGHSQETTPEVRALAAEALRHLWWLRESGVGEVPPPAAPTRSPPQQAGRPGPARPSGAPAGRPLPSRSVAARAPSAAAPPPQAPAAAPSPAAPEAARPQGGPGRPGAGGAAAHTLADKGCGSEALLAVRREIGPCTRCKLHGGRTTLVFGVGNPAAELMFVGEGPGAEEDRRGEPFVGRAGELLDKMIEAMGFRREEVYIANVVKCRPPDNRDPEPDEIDACEPFLKAQIAAIRPRVIVALGRFAVQTLLRDTTPISRLRGAWRAYEGVRLMPTFHPAYLLRNPAEKRKAWEDLQLVMREFGKVPSRKGSA
jgi:DNA polymerase